MHNAGTPAAGCESSRPDSAEQPSACSEIHCWDQQPGEPDNYYRAFQEYLRLGRNRSILAARDVAIQAGVSGLPAFSTIRVMSGYWHWHKRAKAWDAANIDQEVLPTIPPWDQQAGEPDRDYRILRVYLELGPKRTLPAALKAAAPGLGVGKIPSREALKYIYHKWSWPMRAKAWDEANQQAAVAVEPQPWDQLPRESDRAYAVFKHFLTLGPLRTVSDAVNQALKQDGRALTYGTAINYAKWMHWRERAVAWDQEQFAAELEGQGVGDEDLIRWGVEETRQDGQPWDIQPGEPSRMYSLFCHYLELGPMRSIARVYRDCEIEYAGLSQLRPNYYLVKRWKWLERAAAWDAHQRDQLAERINNLRAALEEQRLSMAEIWLDQAVDAFQTANLPGLDEATARRMMPTIHRMMVDAGAIQRMELDLMAKRGAAVQNQGKVTAETMYAYSEMLAKAQAAEAARAEEAARQAAATAGPRA